MANYRQQTVSGLGVNTPCTSCYTAISLYYSSTSADDLCCAQTSTTTYFLAPGVASFGAANVIYSDDIGTVASDGFYREN
mgnify:FL=1